MDNNPSSSAQMEELFIEQITESKLYKLESESESGCKLHIPKKTMAWAIFDRRGKMIVISFNSKIKLWKSLGDMTYPCLNKSEKISYLKNAGFRCFRVEISAFIRS